MMGRRKGKPTIPIIKRFGGHRFKFHGYYCYKSDAVEDANRYRENGYYARVVPMNLVIGKRYVIYLRKK